ncbi:MAG: hypothetical protein J6T86_04255 [Bacteroidales bacterium]|nr:hypothetical protein [Bacteroidales bacterium]
MNNLGDFYKEENDNYYFLFDITGDGSPELWIVVTEATTKAERGLFVYTFEKGKYKEIYFVPGVVTDIGVGEKCVVCESGDYGCGGCGYSHVSILTYDGQKIIEKIIKREEYDPDGDRVVFDISDEYLPMEKNPPKTAKLYEAYKLTTGSYFK